MIRRLTAALLLAVIGIIAVSMPVQAFDPFQVNCGDADYSKSAICQTPAESLSGPGGPLLRITNLVTMVAGALAVILIIYGAIKYITSGGDSSNIQSAKNTIMYALIGVAVIALAQTIINFVVLKL